MYSIFSFVYRICLVDFTLTTPLYLFPFYFHGVLKYIIVFSWSQGDAVDYQKQLKQMIKDLAKEKDKTEKELPKMSQVWTLILQGMNLFANLLRGKLESWAGPLYFQNHNPRLLNTNYGD